MHSASVPLHDNVRLTKQATDVKANAKVKVKATLYFQQADKVKNLIKDKIKNRKWTEILSKHAS